MTFAEAVAYKDSLLKFGIRLGLERFNQLMALLPTFDQPVVHVAGTNGKGSCCALISKALLANGYKVGTYSSPHLWRVTERISIDGVAMSQDDFAHMATQVQQAAAQLSEPITEFELLTAMAFLYFEQQQVDVAVVEVGLGGEFDATNIVKPTVCAITSIGYDHVAILGSTLTDIASAKAGIIKSGCPVVVGPVPPEAFKVIEATAQKHGAELIRANSPFLGTLALEGSHQRHNASVAWEALMCLERAGFNIDHQKAKIAFANATLAGRFQVYTLGSRTVVLDVAHNLEGAAALAANLQQHFGSQTFDVVVGFSQGHDPKAFLNSIKPHIRSVRCVTPSFKPLAASVTWGAALELGLEATIDEHWNWSTIGNHVLVTGSFYVVGLLPQAYRPEVQ